MSESEAPEAKSTDRTTLVLRWVVGAILGAIVIAAAWYTYAYAATPAAIRHPAHDHFHFRLQILVDSQAVNFADAKYQTAFNKDLCTATITKEPFHFHDEMDQFVHIHWKDMTGGLLLKNYGWNLIGGTARTLGYRFDKFPTITRVPIHGRELPKPGVSDKYYIYTGDEKGYISRDWKEFLKSDLRSFFTSEAKDTSWLDPIIPAAYAHQDNEEQLAKLNDVLGSAVIFVQKNPPSDAQIKDRFAHLIDLPESSCGG